MISGVKIYRGAPSIYDLLFVDDNLVFCKANVEQKKSAALLDIYEKALEYIVNKKKTTLTFSKNSPTTLQTTIQEL